MSLTEQSDGWYAYRQSDGDIEIRETEEGFEFRYKQSIIDHASFPDVGGADIGELMESAVIAWRDRDDA